MDLTTNSSSAPTHAFIFPILKSGEILQCMSELGIEMSKEELTEPQRHKEKLRQIFVHLLDICTGLTEEDFQATPAMKATAETMPYASLHQDFGEVKFFRSLRECMITTGLPDFSWRDLHAPTAKRLRFQLSAVINLAKFREEQLKVYAELNEPRSELLQALEELNVENAQLAEHLDQTAGDSQIKYSEMEQVITDCQELEMEIARNNKLQAAAREEAAAFKKQANDLKDQLATAQWALQEAEAEEEALRSKIVSSPDRRKMDLAAKKERLERDKEECSDLQMQIQDCKTKAMHVQQATKDMQSVLVVLEELQLEFSRYEQLVRQSEETIEKIEANEKKAADILEETEETERYLHRSEEKIVHQRKQHKMQVEASHDALEMVKSQLLAVEKDRRDGMARVEAGETEVRALEAAIGLARVKTQEEIQTMIAEYNETEKLYLARNNKRMTAIGAM